MISKNNKINNYLGFSFIYFMFCIVIVFIYWLNLKMMKIVKLEIMINLYYMLECFIKKFIVFFVFKLNLVLISGILVVFFL